jgi:hypothetical protein
LSLGHFCHEAFEKPPFLDPCLYLLTKFHRNIQGTGTLFFFPREQSHLMKGSFLGTSASRIATAFFCKSKGGLDKGFYLPKPIQSRFSQVAGHSMTWHKVSIYTSLMLVNKKMIPLRKNILRRVDCAEKRQDWSGSETRKIFTLHCCEKPKKVYLILNRSGEDFYLRLSNADPLTACPCFKACLREVMRRFRGRSWGKIG